MIIGSSGEVLKLAKLPSATPTKKLPRARFAVLRACHRQAPSGVNINSKDIKQRTELTLVLMLMLMGATDTSFRDQTFIHRIKESG